MANPYSIGTANAGSGTSLAVTVATPTVKGDVIVVFAASSVNTSQPTGAVDSKGNSYRAVTTTTAGPGGGCFVADGQNNPGGPAALTVSDTITVSYANTSNTKLAAAVGMNGASASVSAVDQAPAAASGSSTSPSVSSGTLSQPNEIVLVMESNVNASGAITWTAPFTALIAPFNAGIGVWMGVGTETVASQAAQTATGTIGSGAWIAIMVTLQLNPVITTTSLPGGTAGVAYSQTLQVQYGKPGYTWAVSSGSLPPGLTLSSSTGVISGTPAVAGTYNFTVQVTDSDSQVDPQALTIVVVPSTLSDETWSWTPPQPGGGFASPVNLQQPWLGIATLGGSRFGLPQLRGGDYEVPYASGQTWRAKWANSRVVTLVMWTVGIDQVTGIPGGPTSDPRLEWNLNWNTIRRSFWSRGPNGSLQGKLGRRWLLSQGPLLVQSQFVPVVGGGTGTTPSIAVQAGDVLVLKAASRDSTDAIGSVSGGGLTWTLQGSVVAASHTWTGIWTAQVPAGLDGTSMTVQATCSGGDFGMTVEQWRNCNVATAATATGSGAAGTPSVSVTPPSSGCYVTWINGDWNSAAGTPVFLNSATETVRDTSSSHYKAYYANMPASAAISAGMTAPAGQNWALVAVVLQPVSQIVTATAMAEVAGTLDPTMTGRTRSDFSADLLLSDPYFYGTAQSQSLYLGVSNQVVNIGEASVAEGKSSLVNPWTCVLNGPLTTPIVLANATLGVTFTLASTIGAGHKVTVDFLNATCTDDLGNNLVASVTHAGSRQWLMLGPGSNTLELTSGSGTDTGYAALTWAPGYV